MVVKAKPDILDIIQKKRLKWYGHIKSMPEERIPKLIWNVYHRTGEKEDVQEKLGWK
jgi:hypothetical protein